MNSTVPIVSIAICTRNRAALLEKTVAGVLAQAEGDVEILIVDNGSTDDTAKVAAKFCAAAPRVKFFHEPQTGLSIARNLALREAAGEWVIFLDDDVEVEPGWLAAYGNFFSHPPTEHIAAAGGAVILNFETPPPRWFKSKDQLDLGPTAFCLPPGGGLRECNCAWRRAAALQAGGFDAQLGHHGETMGYHEGADLNACLLKAGYEIWWLPGAAIRHLIHARRLNLKWILSAAFNNGRATALRRMKERAGGGRVCYAAGRLLVAPLHGGINLLAALVCFPFQNGRASVAGLVRAASIAGFICELARQIFCGHSNNCAPAKI